MIRAARPEDASRVAEILIFTKRVAYRDIFHNDAVSFGVMQVLPLAQMFLSEPQALRGVYVYDDSFVKGVLRLSPASDGQAMELAELYVEPVFQREGVGGELCDFAWRQCLQGGVKELYLWVLEKNEAAKRFYEKHGFAYAGERAPEEGTPEYRLRYSRRA